MNLYETAQTILTLSAIAGILLGSRWLKRYLLRKLYF